MKKNVLLSLAVSAVAALSAFSTVAAKPASADTDLRYYYPDRETRDTYTSEVIPCTNMIETETVTQYRMPLYYATGELTNCCGPVGGAIVVGFYDRYYPDLIAGWTPYYPATNRYKRADTTYVPAVMRELYTLMRTNVDDVGVSQADCKAGLQQYFSSKNRSLSYSSIESNSAFNYDLYKQAINANKPVLLFCNNVTISKPSFSQQNQNTTFAHQSIPGGHIVVGYGYSTINYYSGNTVTRTDHFILVSSGRSSLPDAYINVGSTSWLVDGYAVTVS